MRASKRRIAPWIQPAANEAQQRAAGPRSPACRVLRLGRATQVNQLAFSGGADSADSARA